MQRPLSLSGVRVNALSKRDWLGSHLYKVWFGIRANGLRVSRLLRNLIDELTGQRFAGGQIRQYDPSDAWNELLGESVSQLWSSLSDDETSLVAGKVQNLRVAAARLNGHVVHGGVTFSFWKAVGRPVKMRGYVQGRELREGCMISNIGGGLCQLSNALYSAALDAGMEIIERHPHSQIVPGSLAERGRDATVFWNYIDLRFRSRDTFVIDANLTSDQLVVRLRGHAQAAHTPHAKAEKARPAALPITLISGLQPDDCARCEQHDCVQHINPSPRSKMSAYLLDEVWPEFDGWLSAQVRANDLALVPLDGARRNRSNYAWSILRFNGLRLVEHQWLTLRRSLTSRFLKAQGAQRQRKLLALDKVFAKTYAREIPYDAEHLVVPINMLTELWRMGTYGGRTVTVLMTRAPLAMLHRDLDRGAMLHPESPTLADFRADESLVELEELALKEAHRLVTPHSAIATFLTERYCAEVIRLDWTAASPGVHTGSGRQVLFPASALGRKGAFEVRASCNKLGLEVRVLGKSSEWKGFWQDVKVVQADPAFLFENVGCVVLPAFVEHRPRIMLRALAAGIPVICSPECGIPQGTPGVRIVPSGDSKALTAALEALHLGDAKT